MLGNLHLRIHESVISWLQNKFTPRQFLIFSSTLVGISAGLAAVILKTAVHYINIGITHDYHFQYQYFLYLCFPAIGILLTVYFVQKHLKGKLERGNASILFSIAKQSSFLPKEQMYSHIVTSAITVGFGGSAGLESPIVSTGSAIGSNYSKTYQVNYKDRTLLLACGAAGGIAGAFNAPIAGVLFALEVLLLDVSVSAFIPLIMAAAGGGLISKIILKEDILLSFHLKQAFDYHNLPYYILLGLLAGFLSVYYTRIFQKTEAWIQFKIRNVYLKAIFGGLLLALMILFFPSLFGEGYKSIKLLSEIDAAKIFEHSILYKFMSEPWMFIVLIVPVMLLKPIAAALTIGSGGNGGNFAPSLFVGAYLGFAFSRILAMLGLADVPMSNFTIVAMAGILSGVFHAPLTAIFLIAEITGGYELMIPLMLVSAISITVVKYFEPYSIDTKKLAKKGHLLNSNKDKTILSTLQISEMIESDFMVVKPELTLGQLVEVVAKSKRNVFPVVRNENLVGIILLDNIRDIMFKQEMYSNTFVKQLMRKPPAVVFIGEEMESVMKKFDESNAWNLPVVNSEKYIGFISKSRIFNQYRAQLIAGNKEN